MLIEWKIGLYAIMYFVAASSVYSLAFFAPIILRESLGFTYVKAQLLSSPPYVFAIFASIAGAWVSDKIKMRWPVMVFQAIVAIVGLIVMLYAQPPAARYFGLFLATYGTQGGSTHSCFCKSLTFRRKYTIYTNLRTKQYWSYGEEGRSRCSYDFHGRCRRRMWKHHLPATGPTALSDWNVDDHSATDALHRHHPIAGDFLQVAEP